MSWALLIAILFILAQWIRRGGAQDFLLTLGIWNPLTDEQCQLLSERISYYRSLPPKSKRTFEARMAGFIRRKHFVPRQMELVTDEMKLMIAACAIQLTFGLPRVFLSYFKNILIYPDVFYSAEGKRFHKGEVNPKMKAIVLSWKYFVHGYADDTEGINLGLHEMAHALQLENIVRNNEFGFLKREDIVRWQELAEEEMGLIRAEISSFFRPYAAKDSAEFFAVAVENFFERPLEFKAYNQELYDALCRLLNQNPAYLIAH